MSSVITVKDMCLWYGQVQALKNININIEEKSITALIGPSGCGKSTFLKSLNRMNDLVPGVKITGDIRYRGEDIFDPKLNVNELRRNIGMVFQKPNPFPMSIYDNIAYGPRTHGITSRAKLDEIVENSLKGAAIWNEVKDNLKKSALSLSGGQQQRLCIARALAVEPDVLLMDIRMRNMDGLKASEKILSDFPKANVLLLTTFTDDEYIVKALQIGAKGYLLKQDYENILPAIKAVCSGQTVFGNEIVAKIPDLLNRSEEYDYSAHDINKRELEIIRLISRGYSNKEIASELYLGEGTVRNYLSSILDKLQLRDRTQVAIFYYQHK